MESRNTRLVFMLIVLLALTLVWRYPLWSFAQPVVATTMAVPMVAIDDVVVAPPSPRADSAQPLLDETRSSQTLADQPAPAEFSRTPIAVHAMPEQRACLAGTGSGTTSGKVAVHRWIDAEGILHFSDKAPVGAAREHRRIEVGGLPGVQVSARGHDINLPDQFQQRAVADALAIERVFESELGVSRAGGLALQVVYVASPENYRKLLGDPALANSAGAYSGRERTIYVRMQAQPAANDFILRHEITHALVHERIGNLPIAINEGLAGFFERLQPAAMGAQIAWARDRTALIAAQPGAQAEDALVDLLAREGAQFYADGRERRYLHAYALIALMMGQGEGRTALAALLAAQQATPCESVNVADILDRHYPQGLAGLASNWARWMANPPTGVQAF